MDIAEKFNDPEFIKEVRRLLYRSTQAPLDPDKESKRREAIWRVQRLQEQRKEQR